MEEGDQFGDVPLIAVLIPPANRTGTFPAMPKVLIADKMSDSAVEVFHQRGVETEVATGLSAEELRQKLAGFDGLAVRSATGSRARCLRRPATCV
jgi:phosphoglycerate dehydrogenase-like enzyme